MNSNQRLKSETRVRNANQELKSGTQIRNSNQELKSGTRVRNANQELKWGGWIRTCGYKTGLVTPLGPSGPSAWFRVACDMGSGLHVYQQFVSWTQWDVYLPGFLEHVDWLVSDFTVIRPGFSVRISSSSSFLHWKHWTWKSHMTQI